MITGDVVVSKRDPSKIGVIFRVEAGAFSTWFSIMWQDGTTDVCTSNELRVINEERRPRNS